MDFEEFKLERYFAKYEFKVKYLKNDIYIFSDEMYRLSEYNISDSLEYLKEYF